jgi:hypothetical protein
MQSPSELTATQLAGWSIWPSSWPRCPSCTSTARPSQLTTTAPSELSASPHIVPVCCRSAVRRSPDLLSMSSSDPPFVLPPNATASSEPSSARARHGIAGTVCARRCANKAVAGVALCGCGRALLWPRGAARAWVAPHCAHWHSALPSTAVCCAAHGLGCAAAAAAGAAGSLP